MGVSVALEVVILKGGLHVARWRSGVRQVCADKAITVGRERHEGRTRGEKNPKASGQNRDSVGREFVRNGRGGDVPSLSVQIVLLFVIAVPVACVAWTVTHEEVFREPREFCVDRSKSCRRWYQRKFFYLFTCEYCFSHYVTAFFLFVTRYKLLYEDWRGYLVGGFALVWVANQYMSLYNRLRLDIKSEKIETEIKEKVADKVKGRDG